MNFQFADAHNRFHIFVFYPFSVQRKDDREFLMIVLEIGEDRVFGVEIDRCAFKIMLHVLECAVRSARHLIDCRWIDFIMRKKRVFANHIAEKHFIAWHREIGATTAKSCARFYLHFPLYESLQIIAKVCSHNRRELKQNKQLSGRNAE